MPSDPTSNQTPPSSGKPRRRPTPTTGGNWIWLVALCLLGLVIFSLNSSTRGQIHYSDFYKLLDENHLAEVYQMGDRYYGKVKDLDKLPDNDFYKKLKEKIPGSGNNSASSRCRATMPKSSETAQQEGAQMGSRSTASSRSGLGCCRWASW